MRLFLAVLSFLGVRILRGMGVAMSRFSVVLILFMQPLSFCPRVLPAGSGGEDKSGGAEEERGGFHEGLGSRILSGAARRANENSRRVASLQTKAVAAFSSAKPSPKKLKQPKFLLSSPFPMARSLKVRLHSP